MKLLPIQSRFRQVAPAMALSFLCATGNAAAPRGLPTATYRSWVQGFVKERKIPGAAVALVGRDGILWSEAIGTRARGSKDAVDSRTIFSIQSISKTITATAVMLAVQDGLVFADLFEAAVDNHVAVWTQLDTPFGIEHEMPVAELAAAAFDDCFVVASHAA